jgi:hypothetical protein
VNYSLNLKAYFVGLPSSEMNGAEKYLAFAALLAGGKNDVRVTVADVQRGWRKTVMKVGYNPSFYHRAQGKGWLDPQASGIFLVTESGLDHLSGLSLSGSNLTRGEMRKSGGLIVVNRKGTHTFDRYLRSIFAAAKLEVLVADAWVDETTFDNVLDVIPKSIPFKLLYAESRGAFDQRATRFAKEFSEFQLRRYKRLHDRFMVVDEKGYVLGPSIKDAASESPALVVEMASKEKRLLRSFFNELWSAANANTN